MLISVIIPIYNSGKTALAAIKSIYGQIDIYNYEIVIVDDCSADDSLAYLENNVESKSNVVFKYIVHDKNKGSGAARNTGIKHVTGDYFAFLDSDDIWLTGKMESQIGFLERHPEYVMIGCLTNMPGSFIPPFTPKDKQIIDISVFHQCFKCFFQPSTVVIKTEPFKTKVVWPDMRYGDEGDVFLRLAHFYKICLQNKVLVDYANGKRGFGYSGVSKKLVEMQDAEIINFKMAYREKYINFFLFITSVIFSYIKYLKRIVITNVNR